MSNVASRRNIDINGTTSNKNTNPNPEQIKSTNTHNDDTSNTSNVVNPFLVGGPPAKFVSNCLKCGKIIWYNEPSEKKCNSGKTKFCSDLYIDAVNQETGEIDVDYALTKKARKKNRKAREERERAGGNGSGNSLPNEPPEEEVAASASLQAARDRVNRLVRYDKERSARSQVYDDQADYFADSQSTWLSPQERKIAKDKADEERRLKAKRGRKTFALDFAGRRIVDSIDDLEVEQTPLGAEMSIAIHEDRRLAKSSSTAAATGNGTSTGETKRNDGTSRSAFTSMPASSQLYGKAADVYTDVLSRLAARAKLMEKKS